MPYYGTKTPINENNQVGDYLVLANDFIKNYYQRMEGMFVPDVAHVTFRWDFTKIYDAAATNALNKFDLFSVVPAV